MKIYKGERRQGEGQKIKVTVNGKLLIVIFTHGRGYFEWGNSGDGAACLAISILDDFTKDCRIAYEFHQEFKRNIVAKFSRESWELTGDEIKKWFEKYEV